MLALPGHGFVMLSMPKCASTSLVRSLAKDAEIVLRVNPRLKHINCKQFHTLMVPVLRRGGYKRDDYELVSLFREPVAWLESWWRYRRRPELAEKKQDRYTGDQSFEEYVREYLRRENPMRGRPARFVAMGDDLDIGVDRIFALERPDVWQGWIAERLGSSVDVGQQNISTEPAEPELPSDLRADLEAFFAPEYDIYARLRDTGQWAPPAGYVPATT